MVDQLRGCLCFIDEENRETLWFFIFLFVTFSFFPFVMRPTGSGKSWPFLSPANGVYKGMGYRTNRWAPPTCCALVCEARLAWIFLGPWKWTETDQGWDFAFSASLALTHRNRWRHFVMIACDNLIDTSPLYKDYRTLLQGYT